MRGIPGSGKSTIALKLAQCLRATLVEYDDIKSELIDVIDRKLIARTAYNIAKSLVKTNLKAKNDIIFDSLGYFSSAFRDYRKNLPQHYKLIIFECEAEDPPLIHKRILNRKDIKKSQNRIVFNVADSKKKIEKVKHIYNWKLKTNKPIHETLNEALRFLRLI